MRVGRPVAARRRFARGAEGRSSAPPIGGRSGPVKKSVLQTPLGVFPEDFEAWIAPAGLCSTGW